MNSAEGMWRRGVPGDYRGVTNERIYLDDSTCPQVLKTEHLARYNFAKPYAQGKRVLDAGCGSGYGSEILAEVAKEVIGIDYDDDAIEYASNRYKAPNLKYVVCNAENLEIFPDQRFDFIASFENIEHLVDPVSFVKEAWRVLVDGGLLIVSTPWLTEEYKHFGFGDHRHAFNYEVLDKFLATSFDKRAYKSQFGSTQIGEVRFPSYLIAICEK